MIYVLAQVAPAVGCALMMAVCLVSMGGMSAWRRWRVGLGTGGAQSAESVDGLRREVESLERALEMRDRSGSQP